ncbi:MAG TPA: phosphatidylglycerophosphatase A [Gammaproteobacteria bacterium]|nr:phosphatidylglycerophosphatase A [Gammaproteobacteria bacterium]
MGKHTNGATQRPLGILRDPVHLLAFGFGAGLSPRAPGTVGTVIAVPVAFGLALLPPWWRAAVIALMFAAGIALCGTSARRLGVHDHSGIVWDEIVGYLIAVAVAVAIAPFNWITLGAAFVLFRIFDILKPWPIGWLDRRVGGGFGIMVDDALAGIYAGVIWLIISLWIR